MERTMENMDDRVERLFITFESTEDIIRFVETCEKYDDAIDILVDKQTMDAKSIMGMLQMKCKCPLEILYGCYDEEDNYFEFKQDILEHFQVEVRENKKKNFEEIQL